MKRLCVEGKISFRKYGQDVVYRSKAKPATSKALNSKFLSDFIDFKKQVFNEIFNSKVNVLQHQHPPIDDNERLTGKRE